MPNNQFNETIQNTLMIDRYRYLDLLPCNFNELKSAGYRSFVQANTQMSSSQQTNNINNPTMNNNISVPLNIALNQSGNKMPSITAILNLSTLFLNNASLVQAEQAIATVNEIKKSKFPVPDTSQMLPYKPVRATCEPSFLILFCKGKQKVLLFFFILDPSILHPLSGGVFPFPPPVADLVKRLMPPNMFEVREIIIK
jgi:hypothetical protein